MNLGKVCTPCCWWIKKSIDVNSSSWLTVLFSSITPLLIFYLLDLSVTDKGVLNLPSTIENPSTSPYQAYEFLPHVCWLSDSRHVYINDWQVFLETWPLYHSLMILIIHDHFLILKSILSKINIAVLTVFWLMWTWCFFLWPLHSFCVLYLEQAFRWYYSDSTVFYEPFRPCPSKLTLNAFGPLLWWSIIIELFCLHYTWPLFSFSFSFFF